VADVSVRLARAEDAAEMARVQLETWRAAYADALPAAALALEPQDVARAWAEAVERPPSPYHRVLVALEGAQVVGLAACEPAPDEDLDGRAGELGALLVEPRWGRRGHGSRLLAAAVDLWRAEQVETAVTWVLEHDRVVAAFLEGAGWAPDGLGRELSADGVQVRQRRWHARL
jgi:GNAT superfamily N-acetyltransferase